MTTPALGAHRHPVVPPADGPDVHGWLPTFQVGFFVRRLACLFPL